MSTNYIKNEAVFHGRVQMTTVVLNALTFNHMVTLKNLLNSKPVSANVLVSYVNFSLNNLLLHYKKMLQKELSVTWKIVLRISDKIVRLAIDPCQHQHHKAAIPVLRLKKKTAFSRALLIAFHHQLIALQSTPSLHHLAMKWKFNSLQFNSNLLLLFDTIPAIVN